MCFWQGLNFQEVYSGLELNCKLESLRRNTQYKFRVSDRFSSTENIYFMISFVHIHNHMHINKPSIDVFRVHTFLKHFCFISSSTNQPISDNLMNFSLSANLERFLRSSSCCWGKVN